ncbi:MAG: DUF503 domain-containing protein [Candidatus Aureabacteria bacterium]|nr:DUF503 domain-containing protein [Candidatus Auribacterota bacterium]
MKIGLLQIKIEIPWALSLKDKRTAVKGLKRRISDRFNVAVSETGDLNYKNSAELSVVTVSNAASVNDKIFASVVNYIETDRNVELADYRTEQL